MFESSHLDPPMQHFGILQTGLDLLDQGISIFDGNLRLRAWNLPFLSLLGFPADLTCVGAPYEDFVRHNAMRGEYGPEESDRLIREQLDAARQHKTFVTELTRPDGRVIRLHSQPLPDGGFVTLYSDVTEQRYIENLTNYQNLQLEERVRRRTAQLENVNAKLLRANEENSRIAATLRRSEARLRLINDTIPTQIAYFDKHQVYQYANKGYADWFGVPEESITGSEMPKVVGQKVYAAIREQVLTALAGQQVSYEYTMERDGRPAHARSTLVPEISPEGEALGCFVFAYDITEQKRMQAALVQAQKMEAVGQLTGGLAHDFNNLLTVIIGNLAALQDRRGNDGEVGEFIEPALQSARRGVQLIKRLLTFSRQQPLEPQVVNVSTLIKGMTTLIRRSLPESILVTSQLPDRPLYALVDPGQLESALLNFAVNARDAMPDGGNLRIRAQLLDIAAPGNEFDVPPGAYIQLEVIDDGCGMDTAILTRAFEPFFTTKRLGLGSGLGLSMAYGFAKQSGGGIRIRSKPRQGTCVQLILPQGQLEAEADEIPDELPLTHSNKLVLLVEDENSVRRVVRQQLIDLGYPVIEADSGHQALELIEQVPDIALLLTDVVMPGKVNGKQLASMVMAERPEVGIVLMSGYADGPGHDSAEKLPILAKPFSRQELARALYAARRKP